MPPFADTARSQDPQPPLSPELFAKIKGLQIRTRRLVSETFAGGYESAFRGRGMEFEEVREYRPGDDVRHIDWKVTARMGQPFLKVHREERELTVMLMVDLSASLDFGSSAQSKAEVAAEVAALLAYTAIKSNDRVGLILFTDEVEHYIPPKKGRSHVWRLIREILSFRPAGRGTDLERAFEYLGKVAAPHRSVVFLLSDFLDPDLSRGEGPSSLRIAARRHDLTAVTLADRREEEIPPLGLVTLEDLESGETRTVDTADPRLARRLARRLGERRRRLRDLLHRAGAGQVTVHASDPSHVDTLVRYFHQRERRR